jgi:integral membrane protein (TIGR01906 family)
MNLLKLSRFFLILILPVLIFLISVDLAAFSDSFYRKEFDKYGVKNSVIEAEILHGKVIGYITGKSSSLPNLFNEREKRHLTDVRNLVKNFNIAIYIFLILFVLMLVFFGFLLREEKHIIGFVGKTLVYGGILTIIISVVLLLLSLFNFTSSFDSFHRLFFQQGSYVFDPENELIVKLYPEELFRDLGIRVMKKTLFISFLVIISGFILLSSSQTKKNKKISK